MFVKPYYKNILVLTAICMVIYGAMAVNSKSTIKSNGLSIQSNQCNLPTCISDSVSVLDCVNPTAQVPWSFSPSYSEIPCSGLSLVGDFPAGGLLSATYSLVSAGGQIVYRVPIQSEVAQLSANCNNSCLSGGIQDVQFGFNYTNEVLDLQIDSNIPSSSSSVWSICGIEIELQDCPVWTDGSCINAVIFDSIQEFSCLNPAQSLAWKYYPQFGTYLSGNNTFAGSFGQAGKLVGKYILPSAHESIFISFTLNTAYYWQEDAFRMFADNSEILSLTFDPQQLANSQASDNSITQNFFAEFNHDKDSLSLILDSTIQGNFEGESWGICDLLININSCPLGLFWNSSAQCGSDCPVGQYPDTRSRTCTQCISSTCISNTSHEELSCSNPDLSFWRINGQSNIQIDSFGQELFVGRYGQGDTVSKSFYSLPAHQSINLKIKLFTIGPWDNELLTINADSREIYSQAYSQQQDNATSSDVCPNDIVENDISFRFAHADSQLILEFSSTLASPGGKWGICGLEFSLISCPYGEHEDSNQGTCVQVCSNAGSEDDETGTCSSDVISSNPNPNGNNITIPSNQTTSKPTSSTPTTSSSPPSNPTNLPSSIETILIELIGKSMRTVEWIISEYYTTLISIFENRYYFGGFATSTTIKRSYTILTELKSIHLYFRFYIIDIWIEQIFWIKLNEKIIFMYEINGSNQYWDFEIQFESLEKNLSLEFGVSGGNCKGLWGISDLLIHGNRCPNGFVYNPVMQNCVQSGIHLITSLILVQQQYIYRASVGIPCWISQKSGASIVYGIGNKNLVSIIDGINQLQFKPDTHLIVTNTKTNVVQYATNKICQHQNDIDYFQELIIDLTAYKFSIKEWIFQGTASIGATSIKGFKSLGPIDFSTTISRTFTGPSFFSSCTIRFTLWIIEIWIEEIFWIEVNSVRIFQTKISGTNTHYDLEVQFSSIAQNVPLVFGVSKGLGTSVFKSWAISDFGIYFNPCPIYYVFDQGGMMCRSAIQSIFAEIFTQHLDTIFMSTTYKVGWLSYILNGKFIQGTEIYGWYTRNTTRVVNTTVEWNSVITTSSVVEEYQAGRIQHELCGSNMDVTNWVVGQPGASGVQVSRFQTGSYYYGDFETGQTIVSKKIYVESSFKWISLKFILYLIEIWERDVFWIEVNNVRIFEYSLVGVSIRKLITVYFENTFREQYLTLTFGSSSISSNIVSQGSWGLSDLAIHYNPCPLLNYFDSASQQCLSFAENIDIFEILYSKSINEIEVDSQTVNPIWWGSQFESTTVDEKIINSFRENSTYISVKKTESTLTTYTSSSYTSSSTYSRTSISNIYTELCNQYESTSGWLLDGVSTSLQSVSLGNHFSFGQFPSTSVLNKGYAITSEYKSVTLRFILYIFVEYINEIFWITSSGYKVFSSTFKSTSYPINIEVQFPHTTSFLDLEMGFSTQSNTVSGLKWGISDFFIYGNPCEVGLCLGQTSQSCQSYLQDSIFYPAFWENQQNYANLPPSLPIWFNEIQKNQGMLSNANEIITLLSKDLTSKIIEKVLYSSTVVSNTTAQAQDSGFAKYQVLTDLIGSAYDLSSWTNVANSQQIVRTQTGSECYLGSFTGDTQIMKIWYLISLHFTVSIRFRLYLIGVWDYELFWVQYQSERVFQVWVNGQDTYKDIELQFDHSVQELQLTFGTNAASTFQWAISDIAVLTNICSQQNFLNSQCDYVGNSVFYALVEQAGEQILQTSAGEPVWLSKLLNSQAPNDPNYDYYGFYNSSIQVIEGNQLVSQDAPPSSDPFDFDAYLKQQIESNQATDTTINTLSFAQGKASIGIVFEESTGVIRCYENNINNLFGQSLLVGGITQLQLTIEADYGVICFGVIESNDFNLLPLNTDITNSSMVACSDGTYFNMQKTGTSDISAGVYILNIDPTAQTINITGQTGNESYTGTFTDPSKLYYTLQFNQQASVNLNVLVQTTIQQVTTQVVKTVEVIETVDTVAAVPTNGIQATATNKAKSLRGPRI